METLCEASQLYRKLRDESRLSEDQFPFGIVAQVGNPRIVGFVSYSGEVWLRNPQTITDARECNGLLYSPDASEFQFEASA